MIRKLRAGMMPPAGARRPERAALDGAGDRARNAHRSRRGAQSRIPGSRPFQRLNRAEYARAVSDLLGIDVDVTAYLPPDTISHGFDNIADVAGDLADVDGRLPARGQPDQPAGRRRSQRRADVARPTRCRARRRRCGTSRARRSARAAASSVAAHLPGRRRVRLQDRCCTWVRPGELFGSAVRAASRSRSRSTASASALLDINPRMSEPDPNGHEPSRRRRSTSRPGRSACRRRSSQRFDGPVDDLIDADRAHAGRHPHRQAFGITRCRTCATSRSPARSRSPASPTRRAAGKIFTCRPTTPPKKRRAPTKIVRQPGDAGVPRPGHGRRLSRV